MIEGSCLCGAISLSVRGSLEQSPEACHCVQCRKHTSSFLMSVNVRKSALSVTGEANIGWYRSSEKVDRGFCRICGSTLFWKPDIEGYEWIGVAMGLFDRPLERKLSKHTFVSEKGAFYDILDGLPQHDRY